MHDRMLQKMREKIRQRDYVVTTHADEEMYEDGFTIWDVESAVLGGEIIERQKDQRTDEWKYVLCGRASTGVEMAVVVKMGYTHKLVIITVYLRSM